jgi:hypothetical protein
MVLFRLGSPSMRLSRAVVLAKQTTCESRTQHRSLNKLISFFYKIQSFHVDWQDLLLSINYKMSDRAPAPRYGSNLPSNSQQHTYDYVDPSWISAGGFGPLPQYDWHSVITTHSAEQIDQTEQPQSDNSQQLSASRSKIWCPHCSVRFYTRRDLSYVPPSSNV